eukprot:Amastigsp_a841449_44.p2 type:complete len:245 gc:universal Amastigsp_a841449_44:143-877(+)
MPSRWTFSTWPGRVTAVRASGTLCPSRCSICIVNPTRASRSGMRTFVWRSLLRRSNRGCAAVLTTKTTSPAVMSGPWSASIGNSILWPSGIPGTIEMSMLFSPLTTFAPLHRLHLLLKILPVPPHALHWTWTCWKKPGPSWCFSMRTPRPWHEGQVLTSSGFSAPEPEHDGQITCLLICASSSRPLYRSSSETSKSTTMFGPLRSRCCCCPPPPKPKRSAKLNMPPPPPCWLFMFLSPSSPCWS